jgi:hypothetical protein
MSCAEARKLWRLGPYIPMPERCFKYGDFGAYPAGRLIEKDGKAVGVAVEPPVEVIPQMRVSFSIACGGGSCK